ncbi:hypothetical protein HKX48_005343 [Thoreauomyces humboldtii]|nr:hypothetical protein HKX48_005343 [Thoreauomyces humboldtii]
MDSLDDTTPPTTSQHSIRLHWKLSQTPEDNIFNFKKDLQKRKVELGILSAPHDDKPGSEGSSSEESAAEDQLMNHPAQKKALKLRTDDDGSDVGEYDVEDDFIDDSDLFYSEVGPIGHHQEAPWMVWRGGVETWFRDNPGTQPEETEESTIPLAKTKSGKRRTKESGGKSARPELAFEEPQAGLPRKKPKRTTASVHSTGPPPEIATSAAKPSTTSPTSKKSVSSKSGKPVKIVASHPTSNGEITSPDGPAKKRDRTISGNAKEPSTKVSAGTGAGSKIVMDLIEISDDDRPLSDATRLAGIAAPSQPAKADVSPRRVAKKTKKPRLSASIEVAPEAVAKPKKPPRMSAPVGTAAAVPNPDVVKKPRQARGTAKPNQLEAQMLEMEECARTSPFETDGDMSRTLRKLLRRCAWSASQLDVLDDDFIARVGRAIPLNRAHLERECRSFVYMRQLENMKKKIAGQYQKFQTDINTALGIPELPELRVAPIELPKKFRWTESLRTQFWDIVSAEWQTADLDNNYNRVNNKPGQYKPSRVRTAVYNKIINFWPAGMMTDTALTNMYAAIKKQRKAASLTPEQLHATADLKRKRQSAPSQLQHAPLASSSTEPTDPLSL